jgi:serine phosphatase RsbU (regulator of sigma subunit)
MTDKRIQWSVATQIHQGEKFSGDNYLVQPVGDTILIAAIDGLGHGSEAAVASNAAISVLQSNAAQPLELLFTICHKELASSRGVVMTLVVVDHSSQCLTWAGVGNVEGRLLRADKTSSHPEEILLLRNGVVGHNLPSTLSISTLQIFQGDAIILATDGIRPEFSSRLHIGRSAHQIATDILARYSKGTDDALVVVARYRGGEPSNE